MALGRPAIGTTGTGFEELITDEETGFLVTPNDPDALADAIISAWIHPKREEIGAAARQKSLEFSAETTVEALLAYFREVLAASAGRR
jgi:glycosyltransferase involved in cell wall biosynthesis